MTTRRELVALGLATGLPLPAAAEAAAAVAVPVPRFDLQGHRGARALWPENTLAGFARTLALGVHTLELDIAISQDGVPFIHHDRTLHPDIARQPDGTYVTAPAPAIAQLAAAEVARYDVGRLRPGSAYAAEFPQQEPIDGARIPRLADLFELVRRNGDRRVRFAIETKVSPLAPAETLPPEPFARAVVAAIRAGGMQHRAAVLSFDWRTLQLVQREAPEIPTVYVTSANSVGRQPAAASPWTAGFRLADHGRSLPRMIRAAGGHTWSSAHRDLDAALVQEAQGLGLKVLAWTVNEPARIAALMDMGVDGIVSDRPDLVRAELQRRAMALPPG